MTHWENELLLRLLPLIPLMRGGLFELPRLEERIVGDFRSTNEEKATLLTVLDIFTGLHSPEMAAELLRRRHKLMIESPVYDWIREEGLRAGLEQGLEQGLVKGRLETARNMWREGLTLDLIRRVTGLSNEDLRAAGVCDGNPV